MVNQFVYMTIYGSASRWIAVDLSSLNYHSQVCPRVPPWGQCYSSLNIHSVADNILIYRPIINLVTDHVLLQDDFNTLIEWAMT